MMKSVAARVKSEAPFCPARGRPDEVLKLGDRVTIM